MPDTIPSPAVPAAARLRRVPVAVLVPGAAAAVIFAFVFARAAETTEIAMLGAAFAVLVGGHLLLRSRSRRRSAEQEARRLRAEFELKERAADCERRREGLAAFARLASHVAHEVRNPLSSIALNAEMLGDEVTQCRCANGEAMQRLLASIQRETARLHRLTDEYLLVGRPPRLSLEPSDLNQLVVHLVQLIGEEASRAGIAIETELSPEAASVTVDPSQVTQAALNLVRNAIQAMPGGGRIRIRTEAEGAQVRLSVADTGPGVPADRRFLVFEPFYSTKDGGTGLGLPVTMQIAREHGGIIELDSGDGDGARFTLVLPRHGAGDAFAPGGLGPDPRVKGRAS